MNDEIILTAITYILCVAFIIRFSIPCLIEWLEAIDIDETKEGSDHHDE